MARVADRDIVVYKVLKLGSERAGRSPYYDFLWWFGRVFHHKSLTPTRSFLPDSKIIEEGFHAYTTFESAKTILNYFNAEIYPAVIAKGSEVFFGCDNEVVSSSLVVYKNFQDLQSFHGKVASPVKKHQIAILSQTV